MTNELKGSTVKYRSIKNEKEYLSPFEYLLDLL
ncbi:hypothetical protein GGR31_002987 [Mesonia maritima]|uniref:Uncharacterized protein n=1 Tax=Mesonia maritima TaxID=1793873 RepID=A0ABU1KB76_9FLAO|nr:hypothetical protein [Mesonia maritima]